MFDEYVFDKGEPGSPPRIIADTRGLDNNRIFIANSPQVISQLLDALEEAKTLVEENGRYEYHKHGCAIDTDVTKCTCLQREKVAFLDKFKEKLIG